MGADQSTGAEERDVDERNEEGLLYLYGVAPAEAPDPPASLRGIEDGEVRLVREAGLAAVVGGVPTDAYADEALDARLGDLAWVGERGFAHERVLEWFADRGPVIPLSLFSLHRDEARLRVRLAADAPRLRERLERLRGRREWGIKLWRLDERIDEHLDELSPSLHALSTQIEEAPPGRRYLLLKKRDAMRAEELRAISRRLAHQLLERLEAAAERAHVVPLAGGSPGAARALALHAAFLVPEEGFAGFQRAVGEAAHELGAVGFEVEFTGPWPPYHFAGEDDE
jgi:hypothetical protein